MHRYTQSGLCVPLAAVEIIYKQQFVKKKPRNQYYRN